ncbi:MAG: hypothetical protein SCALA702_24030 [Melioribacteraceae bacterium]|nr:MAG: hypothetical protein SCALA702_24030 [Melioribacteraceae bacterium]
MNRRKFFIQILLVLVFNCDPVIGSDDPEEALYDVLVAADTSNYRALEIVKSALNHPDLTDSLRALLTFKLAIYSQNIGDTETAQIYFDDAFSIARQEGMKKELGFFYLKYGNHLPGIVGQNTASFDLFHHAAALAREIDDKLLLFSSFTDLSDIFSEYEEFNTAKKYLQQAETVALQISAENSANSDSVMCLLNQSYFRLYLRMKMYNSAFHFVRKSLDYEKIDSTAMIIATSYTGLADLAMAENDLVAAKSNFYKSLQIAEKHNNYSVLSSILTRLAFVANLEGDYLQCLEYNRKALEIREKFGHKASIGSSLSNIGATLIKLERYDEAEEFLLKGLSIGKQIKKPDFTEYALTKLVSLFRNKQDYKSAFYYADALSSFRDSLQANATHAGLIKSVAAESLHEKQAEIAKLNEINSRTKEQYTMGIVILLMLLVTGGATFLSYKNKKIADENRLAREEYQKADKLKTQFLAQMSHEIRTPLNSISNFSSLLIDQLKGIKSEEVKETIEIIDSEIRRLIRTMSLLLDMAQVESDNYTPIVSDFNLKTSIIDPVVAEYKSQLAENSIELFVLHNVNEPKIIGDNYSIDQIFRNIFDNAVKFTKNGRVEILVNRDIGNVVELKIIDTGIGMSEEYMSKLFEPFSQEEEGYTRSYEGNGLGLALVKRFCQINGIDIFIESSKNEGTTVTLRFKSVENNLS